MKTKLLFAFCFVPPIFSYQFFKHWTCIGVKDKIDFSKPYPVNIGELPLVLWKDKPTGKLISTLNICKHMGSKLDNGKLENGCLKCQYHGLEYKYEDRVGETMEYEGKIFWAYKPLHPTPYSLPHYNDNDYMKSFIEVDMECSLTDSAYNTIDLRHPEYVHNKIVGFGNAIPPTNIKSYTYNDSAVGVTFDYYSNQLMQKINNNVKITHNLHKFIYPTFSWSKVSFQDKDLIIGVNFLPLSEHKTRWYVTICHNYYKSITGKHFVQFLANTILSQDYEQMKNQYPENELKKKVLFNYVFKDEEAILQIKQMFEQYRYPDTKDCIDMYSDYNRKK
jgi:phenylpropionate dioxygenase-like ring-hydroxylating dioxygenase large terminal subunit